MVSEANMTAKTSKDSGVKKVFSVPVGKLRSKTSSHCRNGSCSRSGSRSKYHNRLLKKNNRELAYALSKQKERNKTSIDENLRLNSLLHQSRLEVLGWKKKFKSSRQSFSDYRECVISHIKDAVKYSVLLTESLKSAMTIPAKEGAPQQVAANNKSPQKVEAHNGSNSYVNPLRHRVNPMISGHTIKYPTINLKRVNVEEVERVTDKNERPTVEHATENVHVSSSVESSHRSSDMGLSTCVEEDEEECLSKNMTVSSSYEVQEESFRRRTVSFRNRTIDKDKQVWDLEVADQNGASKDMTGDKTLSQISKSMSSYEKVKLSSKWECTAVPEGLTKLTPVVALNDVSKFLMNSNSVNVLQMALDNDEVVKVACSTLNSTDVEKENLPSNEMLPESLRRKRLGSSSLDKKLKSVNPVDDQNGECSLKDSSIQSGEPTKKPLSEDDPLEGTSWMYPNLCANKTKSGKSEEVLKKTSKRARKPKQNASKKICSTNPRTKTESRSSRSNSSLKSSSSERDVVPSHVDKGDPVAEKDGAAESLANRQQQEPSHHLKDQDKDVISEPTDGFCNESLEPSFKEMGEINDDLKKNLVVQSTPISSEGRLSPKRSTPQSSLLHQLDSLDKLSTSTSPNVSSDTNNIQEHSRVDGNEISGKEQTPLIDAKLLCSAFVTVRVKKLKSQGEAPVENLGGNDNEDAKKMNGLSFTEEESELFQGFDNQDMSLENAKAMRASLSSRQFTSRENSRTVVDSSDSSSATYCDASSLESGARPKRKAAPKGLKEASLMVKLRRNTMEKKIKKNKR